MILLTGATGNVGRPLAGLLTGAGVPFRAFVRDPDKARTALGASLGPGAELVRGDLAEPATLEAALAGIDAVFLLNGDPELEKDAVEAAASAGVRRVVKQSALAEGLRPPPFHRRVEEELERSGLGWTHVRPNAFMQTLLGYLPSLVGADGTFRLPAGDGRVGWVDARDIAAVAFRALTEDGHEGKAYAVTGPEALTMGDVAQRLSAASGRPLRYEDVPPRSARERLVGSGLPGPFADFLTGFYGLVREGAHATVTDDVERVTGRRPRRFGDFARENACAFAGSVSWWATGQGPRGPGSGARPPADGAGVGR